uniref:Col_cuticle_N domain-containing protein n=1 Tax=Panagrellus redivivus TaxID=6233 RepID=A0A7E4W6N4_PANRE
MNRRRFRNPLFPDDGDGDHLKSWALIVPMMLLLPAMLIFSIVVTEVKLLRISAMRRRTNDPGRSTLVPSPLRRNSVKSISTPCFCCTDVAVKSQEWVEWNSNWEKAA